MNLQRLFTRHGPIYVDMDQWTGRLDILSIYTSRGNLLANVAGTREARERAYRGVHKANLFASSALAKADSERVFRLIFASEAQKAA